MSLVPLAVLHLPVFDDVIALGMRCNFKRQNFTEIATVLMIFVITTTLGMDTAVLIDLTMIHIKKKKQMTMHNQARRLNLRRKLI